MDEITAAELAPGDQVEIMVRGAWIGPFTVQHANTRSTDHVALSGASGWFEQYVDYSTTRRAGAPHDRGDHSACNRNCEHTL
jgi:hypothetical protein